MTSYKLTRIAVLTALLIVSVLITPPFLIYGIPFSLQPLIIALIAFSVDWKTALCVVGFYILLGFIGLPVFTGGKGGLSILSSPTFGFVIGFIPYAFILSVSQTLTNATTMMKNLCLKIGIGIIALVILYCFGYIYFYFITHASFQTFQTLMAPFFILDIIKVILALIISLSLFTIWPTFKKQ